MNVQKMTQKSMEAIQLAQSIATEHDNQQIEQCHVLLALLMQEDGLVPQLLQKMGVAAPSVTAAAKELVAQLPAVTGSGREMNKVYINRDVDAALTEAEAIAGSMRDDFISVEHILLGLIAFSFSTIGGLLVGKLMYKLSGGKINPLIGSAGVSAVPMAARVSQREGQKANPSNFLLMHAMGPNVAGVIGSAVAAGFMLAIFM